MLVAVKTRSEEAICMFYRKLVLKMLVKKPLKEISISIN